MTLQLKTTFLGSQLLYPLWHQDTNCFRSYWQKSNGLIAWDVGYCTWSKLICNNICVNQMHHWTRDAIYIGVTLPTQTSYAMSLLLSNENEGRLLMLWQMGKLAFKLIATNVVGKRAWLFSSQYYCIHEKMCHITYFFINFLRPYCDLWWRCQF